MNLVDVLRARRRIAPYVRRTPLVRSLWLSDLSGGDVRLKLESLQLANSFKSRGAFNNLLTRPVPPVNQHDADLTGQMTGPGPKM